MRYVIVPLILAISCVVPLAEAHPHDEPESVAELKKEIDTLRAELAELRLEYAQLQKKLENQEQKPKPEIEEEQDTERIIKYSSADQMLKRLPEKLNPSRQGWSLGEMEQVKQWLSDELTGRTFEATRTVKGANILKMPNSRWDVVLYLEPTPMRYKSWGMEEKIDAIRLKGDADFAEASKDKYRTGKKVRISGIVHKAYWTGIPHKSNTKSRPSEMTLILEHVEIE